jgi:hypothetical protein
MSSLSNSSPLSVQRPLLKGRQNVAGLWFPSDWLDETERARRVLTHWRVGAIIFRFTQGDLLRFVAPEEQYCETMGGWPLMLMGHTLCSAHMSHAEVAVTPIADVWLVLGGRVCMLNFSDAFVLDPSQWMAVDGVVLHDTVDFSATLAHAVELAPVNTSRDLREVLTVPAASDAQREFVHAVNSRRKTDGAPSFAKTESRRFALSINSWPLWLLVIVVVVVAVIAMYEVPTDEIPMPASKGMGWTGWLVAGLVLRYLLQRGADGAGAVGGANAPRPNVSSLPERGHADVQPQAWRRWLARMAITSQVSRLLGRRQAAYVRKMLELFESGRLDEALRHAIPLGNDNASLGQAFGTPNARENLQLNRKIGVTLGIRLGDDLDAYLRKLYRRSFDKLDREGRVDEACFVLAELLKVRQEALDYLEKHQRYTQAAELALAWDCSPDVIVRLQCLAGNWRHAVAVARRDNAFANAVIQLEKRWPEAASRLREEWAKSLVVRGDWLGAVEVIWPIVSLRVMAVDWLLSAEAAGGRLEARALVKRVLLLPDTWVDCADRLEMLRDDPACSAERAAIAVALLALKDSHPRARQLARIVLPAILGDQSRVDGLLTKSDLQGLITLAADPMLRADLPNGTLPVRAAQELRLNREPLKGRLPEAGGLAIRDAVALDDGQHLVALGEAGAVVIDLRGKIVARFAVPAERIVIASSKQVALVVAQRDRLSRVSRLDITKRRSTDLGLIELAYSTQEFDGISWTVGRGNCLRVLDTQNSLHEVLWQVADLPGQIRGLSANENAEQIVIEGDGGVLELWRYALPMRRLLARGEELPNVMDNTTFRVLNPNGGVIDVVSEQDAHGGTSISYRLHTRIFHIASGLFMGEPAPQLTGGVSHSWLYLSIRGLEQNHFLVVSLGDGQVRASFDWPSAAQPQMRITSGHCIVFDAQGRLCSLDITTSAIKPLSIF